jgi:hypothetical protein
VADPPVAIDDARERFEPDDPVEVVAVDQLSVVPARRDVIEGAGELDAKRATDAFSVRSRSPRRPVPREIASEFFRFC